MRGIWPLLTLPFRNMENNNSNFIQFAAEIGARFTVQRNYANAMLSVTYLVLLQSSQGFGHCWAATGSACVFLIKQFKSKFPFLWLEAKLLRDSYTPVSSQLKVVLVGYSWIRVQLHYANEEILQNPNPCSSYISQMRYPRNLYP